MAIQYSRARFFEKERSFLIMVRPLAATLARVEGFPSKEVVYF